MEILVIFIFIAAAIGLGIWGYYANKQREEALARTATELGYRFVPEKDRSLIQGRYDQIDLLRQGSNRYTNHHLFGQVGDYPAALCEYHYETYSTDSKGRRTTHHHYYSVLFLEVPLALSQVRIRPESFFDKIAAAVGFDDIDFESAEFSRRFHVSSNDRRFAYDLLHPRAMEYLLGRPQWCWEFDGRVIALYRSGHLEAETVRPAIDAAAGFIPLIPRHIWSDRGLTSTGAAS